MIKETSLPILATFLNDGNAFALLPGACVCVSVRGGCCASGNCGGTRVLTRGHTAAACAVEGCGVRAPWACGGRGGKGLEDGPQTHPAASVTKQPAASHTVGRVTGCVGEKISHDTQSDRRFGTDFPKGLHISFLCKAGSSRPCSDFFTFML